MLIPFFLALCTFLPPPDWEIGKLRQQTDYVQVGFMGKGSTLYSPSLNLAVEELDGEPLKAYVKAVKEIYRESKDTQCRDLGKFSMQAGDGWLLELSQPSPFGPLKILQAITVQDNKAYILTASLHKDDLPKLQKEILASFRSFKMIPDLFTPLHKDKKTELATLFASLGKEASEEMQDNQWKQVQKAVEEHKELGSYWQYLVLQEGHAKIYPQK